MSREFPYDPGGNGGSRGDQDGDRGTRRHHHANYDQDAQLADRRNYALIFEISDYSSLNMILPSIPKSAVSWFLLVDSEWAIMYSRWCQLHTYFFLLLAAALSLPCST